MVTGAPMSQHGIGSDKTHLRKISDPRLVTMAEYLRALGYQTAAFTNCAYLSNETFFDRGFINFRWMGEMIGRNHPLYPRRILGKFWGRTLNKIYTERIYEFRDQGAKQTYNNYLTWLRHIRREGTPFFSFIHLFESHAPYWIPEPYRSTFGKINKSEYSWIRENVNPWFHITGARPLTGENFETLKNLYDGTLLYLDEFIRRIISELKDLSLVDETLVIITSDHGESFGEHNSLGHAGESLYEPTIKIPMMIHLPKKIKKVKKISQPVSHLDVFPTILAVLNHSPDYLNGQIQGKSLVESENNDMLQDRAVYSESLTIPIDRILEIAPNCDIERYKKYLRTVRWEQFKLIWSTDSEHQLFDLNDDPQEENNIYNTSVNLSLSLINKMEEWLNSYRIYEPVDDQATNFTDPEVVERLRELGYLE
jgi:arylsulfatase A-like enzyme